MRMTILLALVLGAAGADTIEVFGLRWRVPIAADWKVTEENGLPVLHLLVPRPSTQPRRPTQFALAETPGYLRVTVEAEVQKEPESERGRRTSLIIVYAWRDADHFNYAHLSVDTGKQAPQHNGIFQVNGGDRVRISSLDGPATLTSEEWHQVRLIYDGRTGKIEVFVNGATSPSMQAVDATHGAGKVGIGSFFDLGSFRRVRITGEPARN